jgi:hypothetical protein
MPTLKRIAWIMHSQHGNDPAVSRILYWLWKGLYHAVPIMKRSSCIPNMKRLSRIPDMKMIIMQSQHGNDPAESRTLYQLWTGFYYAFPIPKSLSCIPNTEMKFMHSQHGNDQHAVRIRKRPIRKLDCISTPVKDFSVQSQDGNDYHALPTRKWLSYIPNAGKITMHSRHGNDYHAFPTR